MSTQDQLKAMQAELESHVENLRRLRKEATADDASDETLDEYAETIKLVGWAVRNLERIVKREAEEFGWPEPDGLRYGDGTTVIPTTR